MTSRVVVPKVGRWTLPLRLLGSRALRLSDLPEVHSIVIRRADGAAAGLSFEITNATLIM